MRRPSPLLFLALVACANRAPPAPETAEPAPPVAKEDGAHVRVAAAVEENAADAGPRTARADAGAPSLAGKTVLHVGDSMVGASGGLAKAMEARVTAAGARYVRDAKVSESIVSFDRSSRLTDLLAEHAPDVVIVTLGTNDATVPHPQAYAPNVRSIVKRLGARECYWMGPPLWRPDTGIVAMLRENVGPCRFFDASKLDIGRQGDGVHPTGSGGAKWAAHFWTFFEAQRRERRLTDP